tara:strand:- start:718 stop:897 length:180 start_codon:yes stop_codon:yes gene_type:complete
VPQNVSQFIDRREPQNSDMARLCSDKMLAINGHYVYISNRSKGRLDVYLHVAKKAQKTF